MPRPTAHRSRAGSENSARAYPFWLEAWWIAQRWRVPRYGADAPTRDEENFSGRLQLTLTLLLNSGFQVIFPCLAFATTALLGPERRRRPRRRGSGRGQCRRSRLLRAQGGGSSLSIGGTARPSSGRVRPLEGCGPAACGTSPVHAPPHPMRYHRVSALSGWRRHGWARIQPGPSRADPLVAPHRPAGPGRRREAASSRRLRRARTPRGSAGWRRSCGAGRASPSWPPPAPRHRSPARRQGAAAAPPRRARPRPRRSDGNQSPRPVSRFAWQAWSARGAAAMPCSFNRPPIRLLSAVRSFNNGAREADDGGPPSATLGTRTRLSTAASPRYGGPPGIDPVGLALLRLAVHQQEKYNRLQRHLMIPPARQLTRLVTAQNANLAAHSPFRPRSDGAQSDPAGVSEARSVRSAQPTGS